MPILAESRLHRLGKFTDNIITWRNTVYSAQIKGIKHMSKLFRNTCSTICMERNRCHNLKKRMPVFLIVVHVYLHFMLRYSM